MEEEFSVRVRAGPPPAARLLPSERRYSASTALGLALVHLALALLAALLLAALWRPAAAPAFAPAPHPFRGHPSAHESTAVLAAAAALVVAALLPGAAGLLAWHRWYEDRNIRWLLVAAVVSAAGALASLATTSAALASAHERWDLHRLSGSGILLAERPPARSPPAGARRGSTPPTTAALPATMPARPAMPAEPAEQPINASWPEPDHTAAAAEGNETLASPEHSHPAYETVTSALNGSPAPTESDSSPHVFLFPGVHSPVDPEDENGTFQNIWKHLSGDVGLVHPPNTEPKSEMGERVGTTTVEEADTRFDASEYAHEHRPPQEEPHDFPPTESYYHSDDYEMETDGSYPDWQHDVRIVPTNIPSTHAGYSADRQHSDGEEHVEEEEHTNREEHSIAGDETSPDHEPNLHREGNVPDIPYGLISPNVPHEQISPHVLHEKTTYDHPSEEIPHDDLHEKISPDFPHKEISPDAPHEELSPNAPQEDISPDASHDEISPEALHEEISPDALHEEMSPDASHEEISPDAPHAAHERRRREDAEYGDDPEDAHGFPSASRFWDPRATMSFVLSLNLIVAAVAEFAWSLWTLLFAWRGARSGYPGDEERRSPPVTPQPLAAAATANAHAPPAPKHGPAAHAHAQAHASHLHKLRRPDIISNHQQKDPILQETTMPYQERVRRFLASEAPASAETQIE